MLNYLSSQIPLHITVHDMGKELVQFILATYPALEESLPY